MKALGLEGIAFAIQIDEIKRVMRQLELHGRVLRPYLGLRFFELTPHLAGNINERVHRERARKAEGDHGADERVGAGHEGWSPDRTGDADVLLPPNGLHVMHVAPDSPAQSAGVRVGDTIVGLRAGEAEAAVSIASTKQLVDRLADHVGGQVELEVWRDGSPGHWLNINVEGMSS
jgi:S1-C subfamily serine protease